ncbi:MAG: hypothetical protein DMG59_05915 [Acidobacteria bacterium]|jgi:hypothetical protein|nr:MAG: hypothetical protein DMG59_05915 [Acidobacteriota bacterium]
MRKYRVNAPIAAVLQMSGGRQLSATLPVGAVLSCGSPTRSSEALFGMVKTLWDGRVYLAFQRDLDQKCELVHEAAVT